jgi:signal transduction histidine kinase
MSLFSYRPLSNGARRVLLTITGAALLADAVLRVTDSHAAAGLQGLSDLVTIFATGSFSWLPPVAVGLLVMGGVFSAFVGAGMAYLLGMLAVFGLVTLTGSRALVALYAAAITALAASQMVKSNDGAWTVGGVIAFIVIGTASFFAGRGFRRQADRAVQAARRQAEAEKAMARERVALADELHDTVAQSLTRVMTRSRSSARPDDSTGWRSSETG